MDIQPQFGFKEVLGHVIGDMAKAVSVRNGESKQQQLLRLQIATRMILSLCPRDVLEALLAGHAVMLHAVMTDSIHDTLEGQIDTMRRATRANIVGMNKAFHMNVDKLEHYQQRPSQGTREAAEAARTAAVQAAAEAPSPDNAPRPQAQAAQPSAAAPSVPQAPAQTAAVQTARPARHVSITLDEIAANPEAMAALKAQDYERFESVYRPSPEAIAACLANPEAMAAMNAGDPTRFAIAMGIVQPSEAYVAAAGRMGAPERPASNGHANSADSDGTNTPGAD
jgi:hypothetical protein